jgi:pantetheine-phosphate adenylyltransferase
LNEKIAIYPGSFDPITNGHVDLIQRGLRIFDRIIVAVAPSLSKSPLFTVEERVAMIRQVLESTAGTEVDVLDGLLVDYVRRKRATVVIRGMRAVSDFEHEFQLALMNRKMDAQFEAIFLMPSARYTFLSSSIVKEVAGFGRSLQDMVPAMVEEKLREKLQA